MVLLVRQGLEGALINQTPPHGGLRPHRIQRLHLARAGGYLAWGRLLVLMYMQPLQRLERRCLKRRPVPGRTRLMPLRCLPPILARLLLLAEKVLMPI